ncbi:ECF transporter S component [Senegalia massiliensis]|uniref:ECF transporter S component n=1 Tax=Senegalia massiliensis TaxID=1720316 RepID=A0A845R1M6_9CLOT|nr:ECF transporter S component [Senegalia massiliensis]NBI06483.1 ECF transporter S component [Senegalia massiliensis]
MTNTKTYEKITTTKLTYSGVLIALSFIGAMIKYPGTTIALDSMPGFFASIFLGPVYGAVVAGLGHLLTAMTSGFPLSLPMHLEVMALMAFTAFVFGKVYIKGFKILSNVVAIILNGPISAFIAGILASILALPFSGMALFMAIVIPLTLASMLNIIAASTLFEIIKKKER